MIPLNSSLMIHARHQLMIRGRQWWASVVSFIFCFKAMPKADLLQADHKLDKAHSKQGSGAGEHN